MKKKINLKKVNVLVLSGTILGSGVFPSISYAQASTLSQEQGTTASQFEGKTYDEESLRNEVNSILSTKQRGIVSDVALDTLAELLYAIAFSDCTDFVWNIAGWGNISTSGPYGYLKEEGANWLNDVKKEDKYTTIKDWGYLLSYTKLHASYIKNGDSKKTIVIQHGYRGPTAAVGIYAKMFYDMGYNVLLPDARTTGKSGGDAIGFGWREKEDVVQWINQVPSDHEIVLMGESMGAATMMMVSGMSNIPTNVKAIISDSGYTSLDEQIKYLYNYVNESVGGIIPQEVLTHLDKKVKSRLKFAMSEASAINQVAKSELPMLFIHGEEDSFVPSFMIQQVYEAKTEGDKELFTVPGANHTQSISYSYPEYKQKVTDFLSNYVTK